MQRQPDLGKPSSAASGACVKFEGASLASWDLLPSRLWIWQLFLLLKTLLAKIGYLYLLFYWIQAQLFSSISDSSNVGRIQMDRTGLSYKEQEQGSSLIEKGYDFYKDIQFIEGQPNKKSGLNSSRIKIHDNFRMYKIFSIKFWYLNDLLFPTIHRSNRRACWIQIWDANQNGIWSFRRIIWTAPASHDHGKWVRQQNMKHFKNREKN